MPRLPSLDVDAFTPVPFKPGKRDWWSPVPAVPGWYVIETDAPVAVLEKLIPTADRAKHCNFARRATAVAFLREHEEVILPSAERGSYVVYSSEAGNLKARAREHTHGNGGTACLGLSAYPELERYRWAFLHRTCEEHVPGSRGDKLLRTLLEQRWRGQHGWPLLCTR